LPHLSALCCHHAGALFPGTFTRIVKRDECSTKVAIGTSCFLVRPGYRTLSPSTFFILSSLGVQDGEHLSLLSTFGYSEVIDIPFAFLPWFRELL
jgi:hypothetical protein